MDYLKIVLIFNLSFGCVLGVLNIGHGVDYFDDIYFEGFPYGDYSKVLESTVSKTVKRYYCSVDHARYWIDSEEVPLVFGANAWKFPAQDVNFRLSYPLINPSTNSTVFITSVEVLLQFNGQESEGFITDGGVMQDRITLSFVMKNITQLAYRLRLHGKDVTKLSLPTGLIHVNFCSPGDPDFETDVDEDLTKNEKSKEKKTSEKLNK